MVIVKLCTRSVFSERDIVTRRLKPSLASHAPKDKRITLSIIILIEECEMSVGIRRTRLRVRDSRARRTINRCERCNKMARIARRGIRTSNNIIGLRLMVYCRLTRPPLRILAFRPFGVEGKRN